MLPKIQIEIVIRDQEVDKLITTIISAARTGTIGDGKIFILRSKLPSGSVPVRWNAKNWLMVKAGY